MSRWVLWISFFAGLSVNATLFSEKIEGSNLSIKAVDSSKDQIRPFVRTITPLLSQTELLKCMNSGHRNSICEDFSDSNYKKEKELVENEVIRIAKENKYEGDFESLKNEFSVNSILPGVLLQKIVNLNLKGWVGDYKNAIYASLDFEKIKIPVSLTLTDAFTDSVPYAIVSMNHGWMVTTTEADKISLNEKNRIKKITIFADSTLRGPLISLWTKAISIGGLEVLKFLKNKSEIKNHWAYVYFDFQDNTICSANIRCLLNDPRKREIKIQWKDL